MTRESPTSRDEPVDRVVDHLLGLADETESALYEAIESLRGEYRHLSEAGLIALARPAMQRLVAAALVEVYRHSQRGPVSSEEDQQVRAELEHRMRAMGSSQPLTGPVGVPVDTPMSPVEIRDALADDTSWRPPEGVGDRPWFETPHVYFMATKQGTRTYRGGTLRMDKE
jgi:hypothetical protein